MEIIQATEKELNELISFYQVVTDNMEENALTQWQWGRYPNEDMIREDMEAGRLYYLREDGEIAAAVVVAMGQEPEYADLKAAADKSGKPIREIKEQYPELYQRRGENLFTFKTGNKSENFYF